MVSVASGGYLDFYSSLTLDENGRVGGLNQNKVPNYVPGLHRNGAKLTQNPKADGFELALPSGEVHHFDVDGRLRLSTDARGHTRVYTYEYENLKEISDGEDKRITLHYKQGWLESVEGPYEAGDPRNEKVEYIYNGKNLYQVRDSKSGDQLEYAYGEQDRILKKRIGPDGQISFNDDACTDGSGRTCATSSPTANWSFEFTRDEVTGENKQVSALHPVGLASLYWENRFNDFGQMRSFSDANGAVHELIWADPGDTLPTGYSSPLPDVQDIYVQRTGDGVVKIFNPNNALNSDSNNPEATVEWLKKDTSGAFDPATWIGKPYAVIDVQGNRTEFEYDPSTQELSQIKTSRGGRDIVSEFEQIPLPEGGRQIRETRGNVVFRTTELNALDRVTRVTNASGISTSYEYDEKGRLYRVYPPHFTGAVNYIQYKYDERNRIKEVALPDGSLNTFEYDPLTQRVQVITDGLGQRRRFDYDLTTQRVAFTTALGAGPAKEDLVTSFTYSAFGAIQTISLPGDRTVTSLPDELGRIKSIQVTGPE